MKHFYDILHWKSNPDTYIQFDVILKTSQALVLCLFGETGGY